MSRARTFILVVMMLFIGAAIYLGLGVGLGIGLWRYQTFRLPPDLNPFEFPNNTAYNTELWKPRINQTWDYQTLQMPDLFRPEIDIYEFDLWDVNVSTIQHLHSVNKSVICYFSAGTYEDWRSDASSFNTQDLGNLFKSWPGESWVNTSSPAIRKIMALRIQLAALKNCDAIDPDNIDGYDGNNGLGLTLKDSVSYINFLTETAHSFNVSMALNDGEEELIDAVSKVVDFSVVTACHRYEACGVYQAFISQDKPVFNVEFPKFGSSNSHNVSDKTFDGICSSSASTDFSVILKNVVLDDWMQTCP